MYPINILGHQKNVASLFGNQLVGEPHIFDFSSKNSITLQYDTTQFSEFQRLVFDEMKQKSDCWGIGRYLEERRNVLRDYPQMVEEGRIYHAGLDIIVPEGFSLHAPIDGTVFALGEDEGVGNYGGYVVLKHDCGGSQFYSLYGHLDTNHLVSRGQRIEQSQVFAHIGGGEDSGGWFTHTHLQILTERAIEENMMLTGYVSMEMLPQIELYFPTPYPLFRY